MCYSGTCPWELRGGECGKRPKQVCPETCESDEDYKEKVAESEEVG
jgi:hypothetical protein